MLEGMAWASDRPRTVQVVADASAVLQDLRFSARTGEVGCLAKLAICGSVRMPGEMVAQVDARIERVAGGNEVTTQSMRRAWIRWFEPHIIVTYGDGAVLTPADEDLAVRDATDLPLVDCMRRLEQPVLLTCDADLISLGYAHPRWLETARAATDIVTVDVAIETVAHGAPVAIRAGNALVRNALDGSTGSALLLGGLLGAAISLLARSDDRAAMIQRARQAAAAVIRKMDARAAALQTLATPDWGIVD